MHELILYYEFMDYDVHDWGLPTGSPLFIDYVKEACYDLFCGMHVVHIAPLLPGCFILGIYMYFRYFLPNYPNENTTTFRGGIHIFLPNYSIGV